ncbi:MAG: DNA-3-methyladenine glycosylase [Candidatus Nanohaloarchaeota archaeon QJJ-9]|nr:DNA-3-methyladenine glycosylase [Candidatus Nanohaloarchaeota archaeon QJJ-9]
MGERLKRKFFKRDSEKVAKELLGNNLVKKNTGMKGRIVETEAYYGDHDVKDPASHAFSGKTDRNKVMFGEAGQAYVYICYGIHHMLNITTGEKGKPGAVLIRAIEPLKGQNSMEENRGVKGEEKLCNGPGKLCEAFNITKEQNGEDLTEGNLRIEHGEEVEEIVETTRIGVSQGEDLELRFYEKGSRFVSKN